MGDEGRMTAEHILETLAKLLAHQNGGTAQELVMEQSGTGTGRKTDKKMEAMGLEPMASR